jgi:hypothetical protein
VPATILNCVQYLSWYNNIFYRFPAPCGPDTYCPLESLPSSVLEADHTGSLCYNDLHVNITIHRLPPCERRMTKSLPSSRAVTPSHKIDARPVNVDGEACTMLLMAVLYHCCRTKRLRSMSHHREPILVSESRDTLVIRRHQLKPMFHCHQGVHFVMILQSCIGLCPLVDRHYII